MQQEMPTFDVKDGIFCYERWHLSHQKMACFAAKDGIFYIRTIKDANERE